MTIEHLNPDGMHKNPAFSQAIIVPADMRTLVIGGQNGVDENGDVVGKGGRRRARQPEPWKISSRFWRPLAPIWAASSGSSSMSVRMPILPQASGHGWQRQGNSQIRQWSASSRWQVSPIRIS